MDIAKGGFGMYQGRLLGGTCVRNMTFCSPVASYVFPDRCRFKHDSNIDRLGHCFSLEWPLTRIWKHS